ncbi:MAG: hypothetical protein JWR02_82 [Mucilaginibacter sp.]|nr:hypothetical protein [Mucilaginibacter sp.]
MNVNNFVIGKGLKLKKSPVRWLESMNKFFKINPLVAPQLNLFPQREASSKE